MTNPESAGPLKLWWGEFEFEPDSMGCWQIGPLQLWAQCLEGEWRIAWRAGEEPMQPVAEVTLNLSPLPLQAGMSVSRFSFR